MGEIEVIFDCWTSAVAGYFMCKFVDSFIQTLPYAEDVQAYNENPTPENKAKLDEILSKMEKKQYVTFDLKCDSCGRLIMTQDKIYCASMSAPCFKCGEINEKKYHRVDLCGNCLIYPDRENYCCLGRKTPLGGDYIPFDTQLSEAKKTAKFIFVLSSKNDKYFVTIYSGETFFGKTELNSDQINELIEVFDNGNNPFDISSEEELAAQTDESKFIQRRVHQIFGSWARWKMSSQ